MNALRQFVEANSRWFRGHWRETDATLDAVEESLGISLPQDVRWLLRDYGYWYATGISALDDSVTVTQAAREHLDLPTRFIVLVDRQDAGVILLDTVPDGVTGQNRVYDAAWESVPDQIEAEIVFQSYLEYLQDVLDCERDFIADEDIDYDPKKYRST